jgi:hypothetical protein
MGTLSITDLAAPLKELYPDGMDESLIMKDHKFLPMLQRRRDFGGRYLHIPVRYLKPNSRSHVFSTARTNAAESAYVGFDVTRVNDYGVATIDGEAVDAGKMGDATIFIDALEAETTGALSTLGDNLAKEAYRNVSGSRGQVGSGTSSPITLSNVEDIYFFEVGMVIAANDSDDATSPRSGTGTITAIDEDAGTITYTGTITSLAVGDYLFQTADDMNTAAAGLAAWCPSSAPTSTTFFGVNRSSQPTRLGGIRFDGSTFAAEEVFIKARSRCMRAGFQPDYWFMNPSDMANFATALSGQKQIVNSNEYDMGFDVVTAYGVKIVEDADCPKGTAWGVSMDNFGWATMGDAPRVINEDGLELLRASDSDSYELRVVSRHNFWCDAPGRLIRVTLPT